MPDLDDDELHTDELRWAALMVSAQAGHEADYRQLLRELSGAIDRYLRSRFGHHHFIEDCVQESLVAIHEARHTYQSHRKFRPWLFAIVRHKAIDTLRRQRSHQNMVDRHAVEQLVHSQASAPQHLENQVFQGHLIRALSPEHREAITLTKLNGFSNAEAAEQLHISEGALKVRIHRGIGRLKRLVEADGP
jgi:RNA polymerase sigma-70 factor (ECF subfamily)